MSLCSRSSPTPSLNGGDLHASSSGSGGEILTEYVIDYKAKLGEGASASVYKCYGRNGRPYAIKIITKSVSSFTLEYNILRALSHNNIIRYYGHHNSKDKLFIVTELAEYNLFKVVSDVVDAGFDEEETRILAYQLINAIDYCHKKGIIHRDIKLENIVLCPDLLHIRIIDFGFATRWEPGKYQATYCGSTHYIAPELVKGEPYIGPEVDIWAIGVVLYTVAHGKQPFPYADLSMVQKAIISQIPAVSSKKSHAFKHFLAGIFRDAKLRYTIAILKSHPWYLGNSDITINERIAMDSRVRYKVIGKSSTDESLPRDKSVGGIDNLEGDLRAESDTIVPTLKKCPAMERIAKGIKK